MKLYYAPGACSMSPHIALREAGLKFDLEKFDFATRKTDKGTDYATINPKGYVPAFQLDNDQILTEGPAIVQYIADQAPKSGLAPENGTIERYRLQEWLNFITAELHKPVGALFNPNLPEASKKMTLDTLARRLGYVDKALAGKQYLLGDKFTVADGYAFWAISTADRLKVDLAPFANVRAFVDRVRARPKVQEVLKAEGLMQ